MSAGVEPRIVWRTVQAWQLAPDDHRLRQQDSWEKRGQYVEENPEAIDRLFQERDLEFDRRGAHLLILFDALDRCADEWKDVYRAIRGLLQTALDMRPYRRLRVKMFLRSDQVIPTEVADFPDASKVLSSGVELSWPRHALHYDGIKHGVRHASAIRVDEIREDYPWMDQVLRPLRGVVVPCEFGEIAERWQTGKVLDRLTFDVEQNAVKLPPNRIDDGPDGVRLDLEALGVFQRMNDGRVNVPDVFRVGYGLGRKGGVKPVR